MESNEIKADFKHRPYSWKIQPVPFSLSCRWVCEARGKFNPTDAKYDNAHVYHMVLKLDVIN